MREVEYDFAARIADQPAGIQQFRDDFFKSTRPESAVSLDKMKEYMDMCADAIRQIGKNEPLASTFLGGVKILSSPINKTVGESVTRGMKHEFPNGLKVTLEDSKTVDIRSITTQYHSFKNAIGIHGSTTVEAMDGRKITVPSPGKISDETLPQIVRVLADGKIKL